MFEKFINSSTKVKGLLEVGEISQKDFTKTISFDFVANLPIIEVEIAQKKYRFLFDTAALSVVPSSLVDKLSLKTIQEIKINDSQNNISSRFLYTLPALKVGDLEFCDFVVVAQDFSEQTLLSCLGFDGIFGYNFLHSLVTHLDYENQEIILSDTLPSTKGYTKMPLAFDGFSGAKFEINLPFRNVLFTLDTGKNDGFSLSKLDELNAFREYNYEFKETSGLFMSSVGGEQDMQQERAYLVKEFNITKSIEIQRYPISMSETTQSLVGNEFMKNFDVILDFRKKQLYLRQLGDEPIRKSLSEGFGFFTHWSEEKKLYISALTKGSPAFEKGLKIGERVLAIGDIDTYDLSKEEYCKLFLELNSSKETYESQRTLELTIKNDITIKRVLLKKQDNINAI